MMTTARSRVVCFGEILWDILPSGTVPGGAPMNVAYHLHQLNELPRLITRVGSDERGEELKRILVAKSVDTLLLQTDLQYPTGIVHGAADAKGDMKYEIVGPSAWDFIAADAETMNIVSTSDYLIFGTLSARNEVSRNTLFHLLSSANGKVLDVNLRPPFYDAALVERLLEEATIAKLNSDELLLVSSWWNIGGDLRQRAVALQEKFQLEAVIVTRGGEGAAVLHEEHFYEHPGYRVTVADTVGSGDAFLAGFLHQWMNKKPVPDALQFACGLGALVASKHGAWPDYTSEDIQRLIN